MNDEYWMNTGDKNYRLNKYWRLLNFVGDDINQSKLAMYKALFISGFVKLIAILGGLFSIKKFMTIK